LWARERYEAADEAMAVVGLCRIEAAVSEKKAESTEREVHVRSRDGDVDDVFRRGDGTELALSVQQ
jgi:hypothetical protein